MTPLDWEEEKRPRKIKTKSLRSMGSDTEVKPEKMESEG